MGGGGSWWVSVFGNGSGGARAGRVFHRGLFSMYVRKKVVGGCLWIVGEMVLTEKMRDGLLCGNSGLLCRIFVGE